MAGVVADLAVTTVDQRLAALLLERGTQVDATHQGLADELGPAREFVSRVLEHFASLASSACGARTSKSRIPAASRVA